MKSKVWVFPEAMGPEMDAVWEEPPVGLRILAERGEVVRLLPLTGSLEAGLVGLPENVEVARGPLIVSAFGWGPPSRSVQFELSLLSVDEHGAVSQVDRVSDEEAVELEEQFQRLATKKLTPKWGEQATHGLVWEEGSLDLGCRVPEDILDGHWEAKLPEGDGELMLRTLIDDSLNLLDGLELNRRRFDEGKPKLNLLWPHSFGFQPDLPNLALRRGAVATVWSDEVLIEGMAKLVGYRHCERKGVRKGVHVARKLVDGFWEEDGIGVFADRGTGSMLHAGRGEEARFAVEQFDSVWERASKSLLTGEMFWGAILCPSAKGTGLGMLFGPGIQTNGIPFDTRAWDDKRLRNLRFNEVVAKNLGG